MKQITCLAFSLLFLGSVNAQTASPPRESPGTWFNNFQTYFYSKANVDSAVYYLRKLATNERYAPLLSDLIHNSFAQVFIERDMRNRDTAEAKSLIAQRLLATKILQQVMADTAKLLHDNIRPVYLLSAIQEAKHDTKAVKALTEEFINKELLPGSMYAHKTARYGLMIYQLIAGQPALKPAADKIVTVIYDHLKNNQVKGTDSSSRATLDKRAWYRYMYAYLNNWEAKRTSDEVKKGAFFKTAFDCSPDLIDKNRRSSYFYDMVFLTGNETETFKDDYLAFLMSSGKDQAAILSSLLKTALIDPGYKDKLRDYYNSHNNTFKSFNNYWAEAINASAKEAPPIFLSLLDKQAFSSKQLMGKWVLVDFWGTWCGPCREEHPALQKFYDSTVLRKPAAISLLTIACRDTEKKVTDYMSEKRFSFPVAMSDDKIERTYTVQGYPTKILITPKGKYITIPFGADWTNFIKQYADL